MANNELAIRFTEGKYATKAEVAKELRMSMIDTIWSNILNYRSSFNSYLAIKSIEKNQLVICGCPSINALVNSTDMKLIRVMKEYSHLNVNNGDLGRFEDECLIKSLMHLAKNHELEVTENYVRSLIHGDIREPAQSMKLLIRYLNALRYIKKSHVNPINVDFLAELYSRLLGTEELTSFYRTNEDRNPNNRVLIDRIYSSAPTILIEGLMNSLFSFISTSSLSSVVKAIIVLYFVNYVRPFPSENEEIALLLSKAVLANGSLSEFGAVIPIENLLNINQDSLNKICVEVQKTNDLTYFVNFILKALESSLDALNDIKANYTSDVLRKDLYREDVEPAPTTTFVTNVEPAPAPVVETPAPAPAPVEPVVPPTPAPAPVVQQPKPEPAPAPAPTPAPAPLSHELAFSSLPEVLDEKQAARLEEHLLEMDPALKKGEAYFYARHCTMHMHYTIEQYKKALGCAYETARTSMEHLVKLHYYEKALVNNKKFVYTPIKR